MKTAMQILIINSGSSSLKFQLIHMPTQKLLGGGIIERIGSKEATLTYKTDHSEFEETHEIKTHKAGLERMLLLLLDAEIGIIKNKLEIGAVGHRVVHGGDSFSDTVLITQDVKNKIQEYASLAPLHNPNNLEGILVAEQLFPEAKQVAVFDTAFHQTMPLRARKYAIPNAFYLNHGVQAYGFHGTSHKYVSEKAIEYLQSTTAKIISIHLGNGCSMTAVHHGKSIDHSLGFGPSNGLIMGSRSGDIDHTLIFHLVRNLGYSLEEVNELLTKKSGMLGLTGYSDLRDIQAMATNGDEDCKLALEMNAYRIQKYIGAYAAVLNGLDALIFTAGIGENSDMLRHMVCKDMDFLGIVLDNKKNNFKSDGPCEISTPESKVKVLVIPTNEELEIAKQAYSLLQD